jgi:hypothetical protein
MGISAVDNGGKNGSLQKQLEQLQKQLRQWEESDTDSEVKPQMIEMLRAKIARTDAQIQAARQPAKGETPTAQSENTKKGGAKNTIDVYI